VLDFSAATRRTALERMADRDLDVLVVGGGITGCGVALDAASRGLSVALVEKDDFAAGTSGRSSRMIHGGVRYLQQYEFGVVRQCLSERDVLLRLAPHLMGITPMYLPVGSPVRRGYYLAGLIIYDGLAAGRSIRMHRRFGADELRRAAPGYGRPSPGFTYAECRTDDARLTLEVARTAASLGAIVANHAAVDGLVSGPGGRVTGAAATDFLTGERFEIRARVIVNAAGVWADHIESMATEAPRMLRPSKGVHLVFRPGAVRSRVAMTIPSRAGDHRHVFLIPWQDRVYAGTTDTLYEGDLDEPPVTEEDRAYILHAVSEAFPGVTEADVVAQWAGLRPLLAEGSGPTADLSRRHAIYESPPGLLTITGGKLTVYRAMAEELVDRVAAMLRTGDRCRTASIPLGLTAPLDGELARARTEATGMGLAAATGERMVRRYGDDWVEALRLIRDDRSLGDPVAAGAPVLRVELELARSREMAITDDDVLVRRTRLATLDSRAVLRAGPSAAMVHPAGSAPPAAT
jgi:glycerol-3-phosphate dehydrogenase